MGFNEKYQNLKLLFFLPKPFHTHVIRKVKGNIFTHIVRQVRTIVNGKYIFSVNARENDHNVNNHLLVPAAINSAKGNKYRHKQYKINNM